MPNKGPRSRYWKKKADVQWSLNVRLVGFCEMCGRQGTMTGDGFPVKGLNAHHILGKGAYPKYRHCIDNGICLCVRCHKWGQYVGDIKVAAHGSMEEQQNFFERMKALRPSMYEWYYMHKDDKTPGTVDYEAAFDELKKMETPNF